jgi:predicted membrane-bound spermidine synthase
MSFVHHNFANNIENVLILGGGDGMAAREILRI